MLLECQYGPELHGTLLEYRSVVGLGRASAFLSSQVRPRPQVADHTLRAKLWSLTGHTLERSGPPLAVSKPLGTPGNIHRLGAVYKPLGLLVLGSQELTQESV